MAGASRGINLGFKLRMRLLAVSLLLSLFFAAVAVVPPAGAEFSHSYDYYLQEGDSALDRRDYEAALNCYKHAHLIDPSESYPVYQIQQIEQILNPAFLAQDPSVVVQDRQNERRRLFLNLGKKAFSRRDYEAAMRYFETATRIDPNDQEATHYINLIKRARENRVEGINGKVYELSPVFVYPDPAQNKSVKKNEGKKKSLEPADRKGVIARDLESFERGPSPQNLPQDPALQTQAIHAEKTPGLRPKAVAGTQTIIMDDALWATQPRTDLRLELKTMLVLESRNIDRFLVITPGVFTVERVDRDHLQITPLRIGSSYLHVWDERGRWTFRVEITLPAQTAAGGDSGKKADEQRAEPFKFSYGIDGGTLYRGPDLPSAERESLYMLQTMGVYGDTPYGAVDGSVGFNKFEQSTEATSYSVGLSGAKVPGFTDVNVRGFDASKYFSALTFPGQYFRGILAEGKTLGENLGAVYVRGQDRYTYSFVSPGVIDAKRSYVEGARVVLFPNEENRYGFNFARGYGEARQDFLQDQVYSIDARHRFQKALVAGEVATNGDNLAKTVSSRFGGDQLRLRAGFRDIDEDFTTVTNLPANQGEIGALLGADWTDDRFEVSSNADIYRERILSNADDPDALNYDLDSSVRIPLNDTTTWATSGYYLNTPGELSHRRNFRLINDLSKRYEIWGDRELQTFVGAIYQRSRVSETSTSDYDRYSATTGFRVGLLRDLSFFTNYEYSWVDNLESDTLTNPHVLNSGLNYSRQLTDRLSSNIGFYYRNEENTLGTNSFLAGEDSITGSIGMSYRPTEDAEIFWDSRLRNVWRENPDNPAYNEVDVRWGLRSVWDLPLSWNPQGTVRGRVFKDANANGKRDAGEPGMANVKVKVGKEEVVTDAQGIYSRQVSAKEVLVVPQLDSVEPGYILTSPAVLEIKIPHEGNVNFGFTTDSGIYGVVYFDQNENKQPDEGDIFVQGVRISLDNKIYESTEYDGTYFFKNVDGGKHTIRLVVNSLPIEYLPLVKVSNTVEVTEGTTYVYHIPLKKK